MLYDHVTELTWSAVGPVSGGDQLQCPGCLHHVTKKMSSFQKTQSNQSALDTFSWSLIALYKGKLTPGSTLDTVSHCWNTGHHLRGQIKLEIYCLMVKR